jgi:hypothetical protein
MVDTCTGRHRGGEDRDRQDHALNEQTTTACDSAGRPGRCRILSHRWR